MRIATSISFAIQLFCLMLNIYSVGNIFVGIVTFIYAIVFCFWCVYLFYAIQRKWKSYKRALGCLQQEDFCCQFQLQAYNAKTEFMKYIFLFIMNLVEWFAFIAFCAGRLVKLVDIHIHCPNEEFSQNASQSLSAEQCIWTYPQVNSSIYLNLLMFCNNCIVLSVILIASLCRFLATKYAQKSWISSNIVAGVIAIFLLYNTVNQIMASFCSILIISMWFNTLLMTVAAIFVVKEYRQLCMVITWTIVDLSVSKNLPLQKRQINMKRNFQRVFWFILIGLMLVITFQYMEHLLITVGIVSRIFNSSNFDISLCEDSQYSAFEKSNVYALLFRINEIIVGVALLIFYTPYIGYGLSTMYIIIWRRVTGKTGYKTHYHNQLYDPHFAQRIY